MKKRRGSVYQHDRTDMHLSMHDPSAGKYEIIDQAITHSAEKMLHGKNLPD